MATLFARIWLFALLIAVLVPSPAAAWTRTEVRGMQARAEVMPSGFARIGLEITVEVQGGWVERFEIAGLGHGAQLDALKPPTWVKSSVALDETDAAPGAKYVPTTTLREDGTLNLDFGTRHSAPRRGTFQCRIVYETRLLNDGRGALVLALPSWPSALENVELWIDAPRGTELLPASDAELDSAQVLPRGALTVVHIVKPQLPRTHPLEARLVLPSMEAAAAAVTPALEAAEDQAPSAHAWGLAALFGALIAWKRRALAGPAGSRDERTFALVKAVAMALPCVAFPYAHAWSSMAGALLLALAAVAGACLPTQLHAEALPQGLGYRRVHAIDVQRAKRARLLAWLGPRSWVDVTTPSGLALIAMLGALALLAVERTHEAEGVLWLTGWAAALPLFFARTRLARKLGANDALLALAEVQHGLSIVAREHGASARLEVARAGICDPALHARLCFNDALSLVLAHDAHGKSTLAWLTSSDGRATLRAALDPSAELRVLLTTAGAAVEAPLATAA